MAERWTPGPWDYRPGEYDDWGWIRGGPGGMTIGHAHSPLDDDEANRHRAAKTDPWEANARLMAAAPELYAALAAFNLKEEMILSGTANSLTLRVPLDAIRKAAAALAKARGEAT